MAEIFTAVLEVVKLFVSPIQREFSYLCNHKSNIESLKSEFQKLTDASEDVQRKTVDAERSGDKIKQNVKRWQDDVNKVIDEAGKFVEVNTDAKNRCFKGLCPNLIARYIKSKEASRKLKIVSGHLKEVQKFNEVSYPTKPEEIWLKFNKDFEDFESRRSSLKNILHAVKDENVDMIGVYGMGGAGKTTLAQEVGKHAQKDKLFEEVVFVEVSDAPDIHKIQENIARQLDLKNYSDVDTSQRANKLYERLLNKKFLMILDNLWKDVDLKTVGIPAPEDHKGSKLLLTSRDLDVLGGMGCKSFHQLGFLNEEESWRLFRRMAGDYIENHEFKSIAVEVVKECGGLPIGLVTVGKALRNKKIYEWKDALRELRKPSPTNIEGSVMEDAYSKINMSYNFLRSEELKIIFLLCSLMQYDASVFDLFKYVVGLDILEGHIRTMEEARNRLDRLLRKLKDSCLLLDSRQNRGLYFNDSINSERFSMHDVVRAVAITIACREQHVFMGRNDGRRQWPGKECTKICMIDCNFGEPFEGLECPKLQFFYVRNKEYSSFKIPTNFFTGVANLKVLDIPGMELVSSPLSLHPPVNLQTLCLENSRFEDIAVIVELKQLKILSFRGSYGITQLPVEIGELTQLRLLDLTDCRRLKVIAPNVISRLILLEELYMKGCSVEWEVEELNVKRRNVRLDELKLLSHLTTLEINIEDEKILPNGLFSTQLERFHITVGGIYSDWTQHPDVILRKLYLYLNSIICPKEFQILNNVEFLYLRKFPGVNNVLYKLNGEGFPQLKQLVVCHNPDVLCIVDSIKSVAFPLLEWLALVSVINLEKVCHGLLTVDSFRNLQGIDVRNCDKLKNILSFSNARCLPLLEEINVGYCKNMKEIFVIGSEDNFVNNFDKIEFRQLRFLTLYDLPELTSFYSELMTTSTSQKRQELTAELQSSDIFSEEELETPTALFNTKVGYPRLEDLSLRRINSEKIWHSTLSTTSSNYLNLTKLSVVGCKKLKYVFPASIIKSFEKLQKLEISDCIALTEIVGKEGGDEAAAATTFVFPQVNDLMLHRLPKLESFYPGKYTSKWPELKRLEVRACINEMVFTSKYLYSNEKNEEGQCDISAPQSLFFVEEIDFPNLEDLYLDEINSEKIWHNFLSTTSPNYQNLATLVVVRCEKLKYVFPASITKGLVQLQKLEIRDCIALTEIVGKEAGDEAAAATTFDFPRANHLILDRLPKLESFYPGKHTSKWPDLKKLEVRGCNNVMIFTSKYLNSHEKNEEGQGNISTPQSLFFIEEVGFPNLEDLRLHAINSEKIWHNFLSTTSPNYQKLATLAVVRCEKLKYVFPASIIKSLVQLQKLEIRDCIALTEIVGKEAGDEAAAATTFDFPRVNHLILDRLPKLESFYPGKHTSKWPHLKKLEVRECDNVMIFTSKYLNSHEKNEEGQDNISTPQPLFFNEEINPNLEELTLRAKNAMMMWQWQWQFPEKLLGSGVRIVVEIEEDDESTSIPLDMPKIFYNLQHLKLTRCAYKELFVCGEEEKHVGKLTRIKKLTLSELFDLEKLWKQDSKLDLILQNLENLDVRYCHNLITLMPTSASFQNLTALEVSDCHGLINVVTYSTAKSFEQLRELKISECQMMIEIVKSEEDEERVAIGFNKLKTLSLRHLESLTSFCSGNYTVNFPSLEDLTVNHCPNMKTFTEGFICTPKLQNENVKLKLYGRRVCWDGDLNKAIQKLHQKVNSNLRKLTLSGKEIFMIWQGQFSVEHHFERFKVLEVIKDESTRIPLGILQRFNNLETLILKWASYEEIFSCKECEKHAEMLTKIKVLKLWRLFNLKYIWKEDSQLYSILQNLENLSVNYCQSLMSLVPSSASFENITTLYVSYCNGLINLVTSSVAKSLVRLKRMEIQHCQMMQEIVTSDRDVIKDEIVFSELEQLVLGHLKNLTSFCSGNYTFKFPTLESVIIENCPKMKTFSRGVSSTSKLQKVWQSQYNSEGCWKGDINTSIQELCKIVV